MVSATQTQALPWRHIASSLVSACLLLLGAVVLSFVLFVIAPGDPARVILGPQASEESVAVLRHQMGLDQPLLKQAAGHLTRIGTLNFGTSISNGRPVLGYVLEKFAITATIGLQAALLSLFVSYGLNLLFHQVPSTLLGLGLLRFGVLMPVFLLAVLGAMTVGLLLPHVSLSRAGATWGPFTQVLPSLIACLYPLAVMTTVLRDGVASTMEHPGYRAARASGMSGWQLFHRSLFRPSMVPWLAAWINQLSLVFFATLVLEVIFSIPGTGNLLLTAIQTRDYPVLQGVILVNAAFFVAISLFAEWAYVALDPRLRS
ncbi:MAG: ABC transporter permease [Verrucomicrobia bacterium]|nr:ABC transporter permease [Verrucomicrobiota bacterium]